MLQHRTHEAVHYLAGLDGNLSWICGSLVPYNAIMNLRNYFVDYRSIRPLEEPKVYKGREAIDCLCLASIIFRYLGVRPNSVQIVGNN